MHTYCVHTMYMLSWKISLSRLFGLSRKRASRKPYYRCQICKKESQTFFKETAVCFKWRCSMILIVRMIFYFMFGFAPGKVYRMMGGNAPGDRGCPLSYDTVCRYLFQMRKRVAIVGIQKLRNIKLAGPCQADETFVRTRAKCNRGRFRVNRKFTLVTSKVNFFWGEGSSICVWDLLKIDVFEVLGIYDVPSKQLVALRIPNRQLATMRPLFQYWCIPGIQVTTDAWAGYNFLRPDGWRHLAVVHKRWRSGL